MPCSIKYVKHSKDQKDDSIKMQIVKDYFALIPNSHWGWHDTKDNICVKD